MKFEVGQKFKNTKKPKQGHVELIKIDEDFHNGVVYTFKFLCQGEYTTFQVNSRYVHEPYYTPLTKLEKSLV